MLSNFCPFLGSPMIFASAISPMRCKSQSEACPAQEVVRGFLDRAIVIEPHL